MVGERGRESVQLHFPDLDASKLERNSLEKSPFSRAVSQDCDLRLGKTSSFVPVV